MYIYKKKYIQYVYMYIQCLLKKGGGGHWRTILIVNFLYPLINKMKYHATFHNLCLDKFQHVSFVER